MFSPQCFEFGVPWVVFFWFKMTLKLKKEIGTLYVTGKVNINFPTNPLISWANDGDGNMKS